MVGSSVKTVVLGNEWDQSLRDALRDALRSLGATIVGEDWGVAGSQELEVLEAVVGDQRVRVEAETFIGLTVSGPAKLVERIQNMVSAEGE